MDRVEVTLVDVDALVGENEDGPVLGAHEKLGGWGVHTTPGGDRIGNRGRERAVRPLREVTCDGRDGGPLARSHEAYARGRRLGSFGNFMSRADDVAHGPPATVGASAVGSAKR